MASWLSLMLGCSRLELAGLTQMTIYALQAGSSAEDAQADIGLPLEEALSALPGARALLVRSFSGGVEVRLTLPEASSVKLPEALDEARRRMPQGVHPWAELAPQAVTDWVIPRSQAREVAVDLSIAFGMGSIQASGLEAPALEVVLPAGTDLSEIEERLYEQGLLLSTIQPATSDELLDTPLSAPQDTLRARALAVRERPARTSATWDGAPVAILHVGLHRGHTIQEVERWFLDKGVQAVPLPTRSSLFLTVQLDPLSGPGQAPEEGKRLEALLRARGADHVLMVQGRSPLGGPPEPGRLELLAHWAGAVPSLTALDLGLDPGTTSVVPIPLVRSVVTGPEDQLRTLLPPMRTWDVTIDAERAAALGLQPEQVTRALRDALVGLSVQTREGRAVELRTGEPTATLEELSALVLLTQPARVTLRDAAELRYASQPRELVRYDRKPAVLVDGPVPQGLTILSQQEMARYPW